LEITWSAWRSKTSKSLILSLLKNGRVIDLWNLPSVMHGEIETVEWLKLLLPHIPCAARDIGQLVLGGVSI